MLRANSFMSWCCYNARCLCWNLYMILASELSAERACASARACFHAALSELLQSITGLAYARRAGVQFPETAHQ